MEKKSGKRKHLCKKDNYSALFVNLHRIIFSYLDAKSLLIIKTLSKSNIIVNNEYASLETVKDKIYEYKRYIWWIKNKYKVEEKIPDNIEYDVFGNLRLKMDGIKSICNYIQYPLIAKVNSDLITIVNMETKKEYKFDGIICHNIKIYKDYVIINSRHAIYIINYINDQQIGYLSAGFYKREVMCSNDFIIVKQVTDDDIIIYDWNLKLIGSLEKIHYLLPINEDKYLCISNISSKKGSNSILKYIQISKHGIITQIDNKCMKFMLIYHKITHVPNTNLYVIYSDKHSNILLYELSNNKLISRGSIISYTGGDIPQNIQIIDDKLNYYVDKKYVCLNFRDF
jgi:hypothetical protein